jgi:hypothetical protein
MKAVTINVRGNPPMRQAKVVADVRRAAGLGTCIGWQEIRWERYRRAIRELGPAWEHVFGPPGLAVSWRADLFDPVDDGANVTTRGRALISPNRYIQWVVLRDRDTGIELVRLNTHAVSGGWTRPRRPQRDWRRRRWQEHVAALAALVERFHGEGRPVVVGGDMNRSRVRFLGDEVEYDNDFAIPTHREALFDYLCHRDSDDVALERVGREVVRGFNSDHDAFVAEYALSRRQR